LSSSTPRAYEGRGFGPAPRLAFEQTLFEVRSGRLPHDSCNAREYTHMFEIAAIVLSAIIFASGVLTWATQRA
jgi:hypothetical protein